MSEDYTFYVAAAYIVCFAVLGGVTLSSFLAWRKMK